MTPPALRQLLTSASIAGFRVYRGEIIGRATWEPVLDEATWRAVRGKLEASKAKPRRSARRYLLVSFIFCDSCGQAMHGAWLRTRGKSWYRCNREPDNRDRCGSMSIQVDPADRYVTGELFSHLAKQDIAAPDDEHAGDRDRILTALAALDQQRGEWMASRDAGQLNLGEFLAAKVKFDGAQQELERDLAELPVPLRKFDPDDLREAWPEMTLDERRQVMRDWIEKIVIGPQQTQPTLADVAAKAGVSLTAAYYALLRNGIYRGGGKVKPDIVSRVRDAAEEIGYVHQPGGGVRCVADSSRISITWRR